MGFLTQWKMYLDQLPAGPGAHAYKGKRLDPTVFEKVSISVPVGEIDTEHWSLFLDVVRAARAVVRGDARYKGRLETC
jgi:hypothetical protein